MHKLIQYICDELDELESKAANGKLSMAEIQYADVLAHTKKNLLKGEQLMEENEYSMYGGTDGHSYRNARRDVSYARRRDSMGRYSRDGYSMGSESMVDELRGLMNEAQDEQTKREFQKFINRIQSM